VQKSGTELAAFKAALPDNADLKKLKEEVEEFATKYVIPVLFACM